LGPGPNGNPGTPPNPPDPVSGPPENPFFTGGLKGGTPPGLNPPGKPGKKTGGEPPRGETRLKKKGF